jgi:hypothetical protein
LGPLAGALPTAVVDAVSLTLSFIVVTLLTVVFSELLPKALTLRYVVIAAALTAVPVLVLGRVTASARVADERDGERRDKAAGPEFDGVRLRVLSAERHVAGAVEIERTASETSSP